MLSASMYLINTFFKTLLGTASGAVRRMQTGCGTGCLSEPPSRRRMMRAQQTKWGNKTVMAKSSCQAVFHLALPGWVLLLTEHISIRVPGKQMAHCVTEESLIKGLFTTFWQG